MDKRVYLSSFLYTPSLTWMRVIDDETVRVGLTQQICDCLKTISGDEASIVHYQLKPVGARVRQMEPFGVAKTKRISFELASPISGRIKRVNEEVLSNPSLLDRNPEEKWIVEIEPSNLEADIQHLLTPHQYRGLCKHLWYFVRIQL